ncbi:MAG TPA: hypothetical protein G4N94_02545, partial [Caldilineae bacterium]|nr:hypothetical protein [Caldilineae bacterium]
VQLAAEARAAGRIVAIVLGPEPHDLTIPVLHCTCDGSVKLATPAGEDRLAIEEWRSMHLKL